MNILKGLDISCDVLRWTLMIIWVVFSESVVNIYLALLSDDKSITIVSEVVISNTGKVNCVGLTMASSESVFIIVSFALLSNDNIVTIVSEEIISTASGSKLRWSNGSITIWLW